MAPEHQIELLGKIAGYVLGKIEGIKLQPTEARRKVLMIPLQIPGGEWGAENEIGGGSYGSVHKAKWDSPLGESVQVAVKFLKDNKKNSSAIVKEFRDEVLIWAQIPPHRNVLPLVGIYFRDNDRKRGIVSPFVGFGNLLHWLTKEIGQRKYETYSERFKLVLDIAKGLAHLHNHDIIHGDLNPGNVLLVDESAVVMDFGLSNIVGSMPEVKSNQSFRPPELKREPNTPRTKMMDVYEFGMLALQVMDRSLLLQANGTETEVETATAALIEKLNEDNPALEDLTEFLKRCLDSTPANRPNDGSEILAEIEILEIPDEAPKVTGS